MDEIKILYIDDAPDAALERYLDNYQNKDFEVVYDEIIFNPSEGYENLIRNTKVQKANIIFIDSKLFENRNAATGKFTGEEFKIILKKYYPFIEVIVITQNEIENDLTTISKYSPQTNKTGEEYYSDILPEYLENAIQNIQEYRHIAEILDKNTNWEKMLKEKISDSLNGIRIYDELTKEDIDQLITAFNEIQEKINGERL